MALFEKFKNIFSHKKVEKTEQQDDIKTETKADVTMQSQADAGAQRGARSLTPRDEAAEAAHYHTQMTKSRNQIMTAFTSMMRNFHSVDDAYFAELEDALIMADVGLNTVMTLSEQLQARAKEERITDPQALNEIMIEELHNIYLTNVAQKSFDLQYATTPGEPTIILFIGVNGAGKTTSIGKLASRLQHEGKKVLLVAADTFRAGAVDQLAQWAARVDVDLVRGKDGADPSAVIFDAMKKAKSEQYDVVLCDTAGRLQNKVNLMNELGKIYRVIQKEFPAAPHETLLVIDGTTGQNGLAQAKAFTEVAPLTGVVLSKLDGTAKGGIVLAIAQELHIPVKFIGLGEQVSDLSPFMLENYLYGLFADLFDE
jgi:fused signal recognition particle receptor